MKIIGCYHIKGGVGKTTTVVNLSFLSAKEGNHTLLWDMDPQGSATYAYRIDISKGENIKKAIFKKGNLPEEIRDTNYENLQLIPADLSMRKLDLKLGEDKEGKQKINKLLKGISNNYETIFIDSSPGLNLQHEAIINAIDYLLIPLIPSSLSIQSLNNLELWLKKHKLINLKLLPFFSMVDRRKKVHIDTIDRLRNERNDILNAEIPYSSLIEKVMTRREPLENFSKVSKAADAYRNLWDEITAFNV